MVNRLPYFGMALIVMLLSSCTITEMKLAHDNPLDRIFDSGSYRLVMTGDATSSTSSTLTWGSIFYTNDKGKTTELSTSDIQISGSAAVLYSATVPTQTQIDAVKQAGSLAGYSALFSLTTAGAGSYATTAAGQNKGSYIIQLSYNYAGTTGTLYSNFVVIQ
jgi:hypothetical protein